MVARMALAFVIIQGVIGLAFGSAKVYLAQPVVLNLLLGLVFLVTTLRGKPFAGQFAEELYPFPPEVKESDTFKQAFGRVSIAWAVYFLLRSAIRLYMLKWSVDAFVIVNVITGFPIVAGLMSWSVWYITRFFRRSEEWGPAVVARSFSPHTGNRDAYILYSYCSFKIQPQRTTGGDRFRPDGCGGGGMPRTLTWPG